MCFAIIYYNNVIDDVFIQTKEKCMNEVTVIYRYIYQSKRKR